MQRQGGYTCARRCIVKSTHAARRGGLKPARRAHNSGHGSSAAASSGGRTANGAASPHERRTVDFALDRNTTYDSTRWDRITTACREDDGTVQMTTAFRNLDAAARGTISDEDGVRHTAAFARATVGGDQDSVGRTTAFGRGTIGATALGMMMEEEPRTSHSGHSGRSTVILTEADKILYGDARQELEDDGGADAGPGLSLRTMSLRDWNLIILQPLLFSASVQQPVIYFIVQLDKFYGIQPIYVGLAFVTCGVARVLVCVANMFALKASHLGGAALATAGYAVLFAFPYTPNVGLFIACTVAASCIDSKAVVFVHSKQMYKEDMVKLRLALSYQAAAIGVGVIFGLFFGGVVSIFYGVAGNAMLGAATGFLEMVSVVYYILAPPVLERKSVASDNAGVTPHGTELAVSNRPA